MLRERRATLDDAVGARVDRERAKRAYYVDAEMIEEAPVFRRDYCVDEVWRQFVESHRVVMPDTASTDLLPISVEERDG